MRRWLLPPASSFAFPLQESTGLVRDCGHRRIDGPRENGVTRTPAPAHRMTLNQTLLLFGYVVLFIGSIAALLWWQQQRRKTRLPFSEEVKLLRAPGETQLRRVRQFDEDAIRWMALAAGVPATVAVLLLIGVAQLPKDLQTGGAALTLIAFLASFYVAARWFAEKTRERGDRYLGYFGERLVAEHLEPLKLQGWRIFHDVPASANGRRFNLDHVAVGPPGVIVVETKTRRKGGARPGFDDYKVYFDGHSLVWPWGEDNHGLEQAERSGVWLAETLKAELGEAVPVTPYLTLPGWWVENKPSRDSRLCQVVNAKGLAKFLPVGAAIFDARQIEAVAAKLEARCRDVEY